VKQVNNFLSHSDFDGLPLWCGYFLNCEEREARKGLKQFFFALSLAPPATVRVPLVYGARAASTPMQDGRAGVACFAVYSVCNSSNHTLREISQISCKI
jgi:hypothetical protein